MLGISNSNVRNNVKSLVNEIKKMQKAMNMPTTLTECKVDSAELIKLKDEMAEIALNDACTATNPRTPSKEDIMKILEDIK